ncbi:unnamed protein product [Microthlaspi erraticum]|uniref:Arabidopsis retrotransposon Orf1 C-terminal domain-containing protein n=1 Tax=Microthlaspi erraticum TaxID=1685480 RepID=A0A6D2JVP2_9BRAS|nr:unnamed protein product [Microthlaspi erraticum]
MRFHKYRQLDRAELDQGWGWITFLARGERKAVTFRQLEILFGFTYGEGTHWDIKEDELQRVWATIADGALANTFFARKATGTINEGEVKLLDMGIKPIISRTKDGRKIRGDRIHAGNLMPLIDQLLSYKTTAYSTRFKREGSLVLEESSRLSSVQLESIWTREGLLQQGGWILSFARPTSSLNTRSWMGGSNSNSLIPLAGPSKLLLPNPELTTV